MVFSLRAMRPLLVPRRLAGFAGVIGLFLAVAALARPPRDDLLGIRLGMSEEEVHRQLKKIGTLTDEREERSEEATEIWKLRDRRYGSMAVAFTSEHRVLWATVFVRRTGKGLRFADVGDVAAARRAGNYVYIWSITSPTPTAVAARGIDSLRVSSLSIYPPSPVPAPPPAVCGPPAPSDTTK
jgi:hypothetical protein